MSNESRPTNIYGVFNDELARMHGLLQFYLQLPKEPPSYQPMGNTYKPNPYSTQDASAFWKRIMEMQTVLIEAVKTNDPLIQEKVAELALTGTQDEHP